jgi:hypothetical protein
MMGACTRLSTHRGRRAETTDVTLGNRGSQVRDLPGTPPLSGEANSPDRLLVPPAVHLSQSLGATPCASLFHSSSSPRGVSD